MGKYMDSILAAQNKRAKEFETRENKRQEFLANAGGIDNKIADFMSRQLPEGVKISASKHPNRVSAIDAAFRDDDPRRGGATVLRDAHGDIISRPEFAGMDPETMMNIGNEVYLDSVRDKTHAYSRKADSNLFGLAPVKNRKMEGYDEWLQGQRAGEDALLEQEYETTGTDVALNAAVGAGFGAAFGGPIGAAAGGAAGAVMAPVYNQAAKLMQKTEWARARQVRGEWDRTDALEAAGLLAIGGFGEGPLAGKLANSYKAAQAAKGFRTRKKAADAAFDANEPVVEDAAARGFDRNQESTSASDGKWSWVNREKPASDGGVPPSEPPPSGGSRSDSGNGQKAARPRAHQSHGQVNGEFYWHGEKVSKREFAERSRDSAQEGAKASAAEWAREQAERSAAKAEEAMGSSVVEVQKATDRAARRPVAENLVAVANAEREAIKAMDLSLSLNDEKMAKQMLATRGIDLTSPEAFFKNKLTKEAQDAARQAKQVSDDVVEEGLEVGAKREAQGISQGLDDVAEEGVSHTPGLDIFAPESNGSLGISQTDLAEAGLLSATGKQVSRIVSGTSGQKGADAAFAVQGYLEILADPTATASVRELAEKNLPKAWESLQKSTFKKISSYDEQSMNLLTEQVQAGQSVHEAVKYVEATRAVKAESAMSVGKLTPAQMDARLATVEKVQGMGLEVVWNGKVPAVASPLVRKTVASDVTLAKVLEPHAKEIKVWSSKVGRDTGNVRVSDELVASYKEAMSDPFARESIQLEIARNFDAFNAGRQEGSLVALMRQVQRQAAEVVDDAGVGVLTDDAIDALFEAPKSEARRVISEGKTLTPAQVYGKERANATFKAKVPATGGDELITAKGGVAKKDRYAGLDEDMLARKIDVAGQKSREQAMEEFLARKSAENAQKLQEVAPVVQEITKQLAKGVGRSGDDTAARLAGIIPFSVMPIIAGMALALGGTEAEAGVASTAAKQGGSFVGDFFSSLFKNSTSYTDMLKAGGYVPEMVQKGQLNIGNRMKTIDIKPANAILKEGEGSFARKLLKPLQGIVSPHYSAELHYSPVANPAVELAHKIQGASWDTKVAVQVYENIKALIPGMDKKATKAAFREVRESMAPLAQQYKDVVVPYSYHKATHEHAVKAVDRTLERIGKIIEGEASPKELQNLKKLRETLIERRKNLSEAEVRFKEIEPKYLEYKKLWTEKMQVLASKHASTRMSLALEDTAGEMYPWLKEMMTESERAGVVHLKGMMDTYKQRIKDVGGRGLGKDYVHHAIHPDVDMKQVGLMYNELAKGNVAGKPLGKLHHRMNDSLQLVPEMDYIMERYLPDINKRIAVMDFWGKRGGDKWLAHRNSFEVVNNKSLDQWWRNLEDGFKPVDDSPLNRIADRYTKLEVIRLLALSPSVAFKHSVKVAATFAENPMQSFRVAPQAVKSAAKIWAKEVLPERIGRKISLNEVDAFVESQVRTGRMMDRIADFAPYELRNDIGWNKVGNVFDKFLDKTADVTGGLVKGTELFDRAMTVLSSAQYGATHGMTPHQAMYAMMKSTLENNFLAGEMNPGWLRNPIIRSFLMFSGTPFKILERRLKLAYKSGKEVTAGTKELMRQVQDIKRSMAEGERLFKMELIKDALQSEKDLFGRTNSGILMRETLLLGTMVSGGMEFMGSDLGAHAFHLPFMKSNDEGAPVLAVNPFLGSLSKAIMDKDAEPEFWLSEFFKDYFRGGPIPEIMKKTLNLNSGDIPEIYRNSKFPEINYLFAVPGKE